MKERDYICIIDLKDAYFTVLLDKSCRHLVRFFMGRESLRMPEPVFQSSTSPSSFYQDFESPNIPFALSTYQNFDLPGQILIFHVVNISVNSETSSRKRHPNLSPSTFDIYSKLKELSQRTGTNNRIFRSCDKFYSNNFFFNRRESERNFKVMKIIFSMKEVTVLKLAQLVGLLSSTIEAVLPAQIPFRYLQLQQVSALKEQCLTKRKLF